MNKNLIFGCILYIFQSITLCAQSCDTDSNFAQRVFEDFPSTTLSDISEALPEDLDLISGAELIGDMYRIGAELIGLGDVKEGKLIGPTKRTFFTRVLSADRDFLDILVDKTFGKAETEVTICIHSEDGSIQNSVVDVFPNSKVNKKKVFAIRGLTGKVVSIRLKNKSATNQFGYRVELRSHQDNNVPAKLKPKSNRG
nr:hypothetical protein [uncultured Allomuricauda sp.]